MRKDFGYVFELSDHLTREEMRDISRMTDADRRTLEYKLTKAREEFLASWKKYANERHFDSQEKGTMRANNGTALLYHAMQAVSSQRNGSRRNYNNGCKLPSGLISSYDQYTALRERMLKQYLLFAIDTTRRFRGFLHPEDRIALGFIGLLGAIDRYKSYLGKFTTYATPWILQTTFRAESDHTNIIRIPSDVREYLRKTSKENQGKTNSERISELRVFRKHRVIDALKVLGDRIKSFSQFDSIYQEDPSSCTVDYVSSKLKSNTGKIIKDVDRIDDKLTLQEVVNKLQPRQRKILLEHISFGGNKTLREIGNELGISHERARQIQEKVLKRLKKMLERAYQK